MPHSSQEYIPELKLAAEAAGLDWSQIKMTDNTCKPHPPLPKGIIEEVEEEVVKDVKTVEVGFEDSLKWVQWVQGGEVQGGEVQGVQGGEAHGWLVL